MPGIEVQILNLKLPSCNDFSKVKCIFTIGAYSQSTSYPFKTLAFTTIDNFTVMSISITHTEKPIGGVDIPLALIQSKKSNTFKLSESYNTPDRRKLSQNRLKGETPEITLSIKSLPSTEEIKTNESSLSRKLQETEEMLEDSYKSRRELQLSIEETTSQLSEMIKAQDSIIKQCQREKEEINQRLQEAEEKLTLEKSRVLSINSKYQELEGISEVCRSKEKQIKITETWCTEVNSQTEEYLQQQNQLIEKMKNTTSEFEERCKDYQSKVDSLVNDKIVLMKTIEGLQKENHSLKRENDQLNSELLKCRARLAQIEGQAIQHSASKTRESELIEKIRTCETLILSLKEELNSSSTAFKEKINKIVSGNTQLIQENKDILSKLHEEERAHARKENEYRKIVQENNKLASDIACMEQHLCMKEDQNQIIDNLSNSVKDLRQENSDMANVISEQSGKISKTQKLIQELEENLNEKCEEIEILISTVVNLQKRRDLYEPVANDPIDMALADFLNTLDNPVPVPFTREEEGIYLFGTKRIFVKLEQGRIIIRVGGGFMQVSEFIDVYTSTEIDKFARDKAEKAQKIRMSFMTKISEGGRDSPSKFSACFGVQRRLTSAPRSSVSPVNHTNSL